LIEDNRDERHYPERGFEIACEAIPSNQVMPPIAVESETPVLDRTKLAALKELVGEAQCAAAPQRFNAELIACLAAIEANAPDSAEHAHNFAGVADLLGFNDLANESRRYIGAYVESMT
jgi:hypothetical protein